MARERISLDVNMSDAASKRRLMTAIAPLQGMYDILLKPIRPTRSSQANRFYWGCVIRAFHDYTRAQDGGETAEDCHEILKCRFLLRDFIDHNTGEVLVRAPRSTASLDRDEFGEYLEKCIAWLAQMCVIVPDPSEYGIEQPASKQRTAV